MCEIQANDHEILSHLLLRKGKKGQYNLFILYLVSACSEMWEGKAIEKHD